MDFWVDLRGPHYNTNAQVRDLERLLQRLPEPAAETAPGPKQPKQRTAKQLNITETAQLIAGYQKGAKLRELGRHFGIHPNTAGLILRRNGIEMRPKGLTPEQEVDAERLYATGLSLRRVGERFGVDGETVRRTLISRGVALRDHSGQSR